MKVEEFLRLVLSVGLAFGAGLFAGQKGAAPAAQAKAKMTLSAEPNGYMLDEGTAVDCSVFKSGLRKCTMTQTVYYMSPEASQEQANHWGQR